MIIIIFHHLITIWSRSIKTNQNFYLIFVNIFADMLLNVFTIFQWIKCNGNLQVT